MASDLTNFGLAEMLRCSVGLRRATRDHATMESAARAATKFLYDELIDAAGEPAAVLVRCYKTHPYALLEPGLQTFAKNVLDVSGLRVAPDLKCLTLLATVGKQRAWNDRHTSRGHQAIPLTPAIVEKAPMIAQLIKAFGVGLSDLLDAHGDLVRDLDGKTYGVFFVEDAAVSPFIPARDFVERHDVKSVVGFGGELPSGDLFAVIVFARVRLSADSADRFRNLALDLKSRFFNFGLDEVFDRVTPSASSVEGRVTV